MAYVDHVSLKKHLCTSLLTLQQQHARDVLSKSWSTESHSENEVIPSLRVGLVVHPVEPGFVARANNLDSFLQMNRHVCLSPKFLEVYTQCDHQFLAKTTFMLPSDPKDRLLIDQKAQISADSIIGSSTQVEEKSTIKTSVIGQHCLIGKHARVVGCIVSDHCVIREGYVL
jgi:translation initiation factor eIF-2B subunit gamma